jgi:hypothetical protein
MIDITPIYTFVADDGENIHIDTDGLRTWCATHQPEIFDIPIKQELLMEFIIDNVISPDRVAELFKRPHLDPIIMCEDGTTHPVNDGPNVMLVDGHHRFALAILRNQSHIPGHVLKVPEWKPFQLHNLPSITRDQLRASPILKRDY